ncbi:hypothetical protein VTN02DRAFT_1240 [Thermoascus thermophilus]
MSDINSMVGRLDNRLSSADPRIRCPVIQGLEDQDGETQTDRSRPVTVIYSLDDDESSFSGHRALPMDVKEAVEVDQEPPLLSTADCNPFAVRFGQVSELPEFREPLMKRRSSLSMFRPLSFPLFRYFSSVPQPRPPNPYTAPTTYGASGFTGCHSFGGYSYRTATEPADVAGSERLLTEDPSDPPTRSETPASIYPASAREPSQSQGTCFDPPADPPLPLLQPVSPLPPELAAEVARIVSASPPTDPSTFPRNKLHPCADSGASLWRDEADLYGAKPRWGCTRCAKHFSKPKTLQQHVRDKHKDVTWDYFSTCINNPHVSRLGNVLCRPHPGCFCSVGWGKIVCRCDLLD